METSVQDRFANLFVAAPLPANSDTSKPHLFEAEQARMQQYTGWKIPEVAQTPRQLRGPAPRPAGGDDILTSEDEEDDYVSAFSQKPKMLTSKKKANQKPKPRKMPEPNAHGYPRDAYVEPQGPIRYIPNGKSSDPVDDEDVDSDSTSLQLRTSDKLGNPVTGHFCQFNLVKKFPYQYMVDSNDRVSRHFFANNKFFERTWDIYYIHPPQSLYRDVVLLLPLSQVQALIEEIGTTFKAEVSVPGFPFTMSFFDDGTPQPQLLGTTRSRADINDMQDKILPPPEGHGEAPAGASPAVDYSFAAFKRKMDKALAANKKKAAAVKKKKAQDRFLVIQDWCKQLRRAQRYLGLRPRAGKVPEPDPDMSWPEQEAFVKENEKKAHIVLDPLDVSKLAPFSFEEEPIIISVDIESYERAHSLITEIGISTLDTLDLINIAPGDGGANWMKHIRSRHFRIKGREHLINKDFVTGHPDEFQFGDSEFVSLDNAGTAIDSCFEWPFSVQYKHDGRLKNTANDWNVQGAANSTNGHAAVTAYNRESTSYGNSFNPATTQLGPRQRTILLLGHDLGTDLSYLATLGSRTFSAPRPPIYPQPHIDPADMDNPVHSILEALDTATLYKVLTRESQTRSLTSVMGDLGRTAWYAHCGGNDARYTLEALVGMVIKARIQDDQEKAARKAAVESALEKNGWDETSATSSTTANVGTDAVVAEDSATSHSGGENIKNGESNGTTTNNASTLNGAATSFTPSTQSSWEAEKSRRLEARLAATKLEVEQEHEAWDAVLNPSTSSTSTNHLDDAQRKPHSTPSNDTTFTTVRDGDEDNTPTPFAQVLQSTHDAKAKKAAKKSPEEKRREWEMRVREEDGVAGPVDWGVGGRDGCGK